MKNENIPLQLKVWKFLFRYRATPLKDGESPAEKYLHLKLRLRLDKLKPHQETNPSILKRARTRSLQFGD